MRLARVDAMAVEMIATRKRPWNRREFPNRAPAASVCSTSSTTSARGKVEDVSAASRRRSARRARANCCSAVCCRSVSEEGAADGVMEQQAGGHRHRPRCAAVVQTFVHLEPNLRPDDLVSIQAESLIGIRCERCR